MKGLTRINDDKEKPIVQTQNNDNNYRQYIKMSNERLSQPSILQQMFKDMQTNIGIFTGAFEDNVTRCVRYGDSKNYVGSHIYDNYELESNKKSR